MIQDRRIATFLVGFIAITLTTLLMFVFQVEPSTLSGQISFDLDDDLDGLTNYEETNYTMTDPANADTDGDGAKDGFEVHLSGTDPLSP